MKDVKAMKIEADTANDGHETPEDLYNALPVMRPMDKGELLEATRQPGQFKFTKGTYLELPEMNWAGISAAVLTDEAGKELIDKFMDATGGTDPDLATQNMQALTA